MKHLKVGAIALSLAVAGESGHLTYKYFFKDQVATALELNEASQPDRFQTAKRDFDQALSRLNANPKFSTKELDESLFLAIMMKESFFDNTKVSSSGAKGYFGLKQDAQTDAVEYIRRVLGVTQKTYSSEIPVENAILGIVYTIQTKKRIETLTDRLTITGYEDALTLLAYNLGVKNVGKLITIYEDENTIGAFEWDHFVNWLLTKMGREKNFTWIQEDVYQIQYRDWFGSNDYSKSEEMVRFSSKFSLSKAKIQESVNYVEKINQIEKLIDLKIHPKIEIPPCTSEQFRVYHGGLWVTPRPSEGLSSFLNRFGLHTSLAVGVFQDQNEHLLRSGSVLPEEKGLQSGTMYRLPVIVVEREKYRDWEHILSAQGIKPHHTPALNVFNNIYTKNFSTSGTHGSKYVFLPQWSTGFYSTAPKVSKEPVTESVPQEPKKTQKKVEKPQKKEEPKPKKTNQIHQSEVSVAHGKFDFDQWIDSVEVLGNALKGKVFVIDPGHGGPDLGAHPIARDGKGNPLRDAKSEILIAKDGNGNYLEGKTFRVKSGGSSSGMLHVYESLVVVDVSYRLAKLLKQQGAEVILTRYNAKRGIIDSSNPTTPKVTEDVFSDTRDSWKYVRGNQMFRLARGIEIASKTAKKFPTKEAFFLSIHADVDPRGPRDNPISIKYFDRESVCSPQGKAFADELASNIEFRGKKAVSDGQSLYILRPKLNPIKQSVLVELGNMKNAGVAYMLRQPGGQIDENGRPINGRQEFAKALFDGIMKSVNK